MYTRGNHLIAPYSQFSLHINVFLLWSSPSIKTLLVVIYNIVSTDPVLCSYSTPISRLLHLNKSTYPPHSLNVGMTVSSLYIKNSSQFYLALWKVGKYKIPPFLMCNYRGRNVLRKTSITLAKKATKSYTWTKTKGDKPINNKKKTTNKLQSNNF